MYGRVKNLRLVRHIGKPGTKFQIIAASLVLV